jgi:hypothetical protein
MTELLKSHDLAAAMADNLVQRGQAPQTDSRSYDNNRLVRSERQLDGSYKYTVEGATRGSAAEAVKSASDPWEYAMDARTRSPLAAHQVTGESIVRMNGAEVTVNDAVAMGWLKRPFDQGGALNAASNPYAQDGAEQQQDQPESEHPDLKMEAVDMETEQTFTTIVEATSPMSQIAAVHELATEGAISERRLGELASQMRMEPAQVQAMVDSMRPVFEAQAENAVASFGVDPAEVFEWAQEVRPREYRDAVNRHLTMRNTQGYQQLAQHFVQHLDTINPNMILNAEVNGGKVESIGGRIIVTDAAGRRFTWSEALAAGVMELGRR